MMCYKQAWVPASPVLVNPALISKQVSLLVMCITNIIFSYHISLAAIFNYHKVMIYENFIIPYWHYLYHDIYSYRVYLTSLLPMQHYLL